LEPILDFARGPLFRLTFALMILGLLRIFILDIWGLIEAYSKAGDKTVPWGSAIKKTITWLVPINHAAKSRPFYSLFSILFHVGLILVPLFLFAHVELWKGSLGFGWITLSKNLADILTVATIVFGIFLFIGRVYSKNLRSISRKQDYLWPLVLVIPFITGFICANMAVGPKGYQVSMLFHVLSGELIFILLPFTKIAHCVIMPVSQFIIAVAWRFPPDTDQDIVITLNKKGEPI
jgi:nitrate reductase gamma subunit